MTYESGFVEGGASYKNEDESKSDLQSSASRENYSWFGGDSQYHKPETLKVQIMNDDLLTYPSPRC